MQSVAVLLKDFFLHPKRFSPVSGRQKDAKMPGRFSFKRLLGWDNQPSREHTDPWWHESHQRRECSNGQLTSSMSAG